MPFRSRGEDDDERELVYLPVRLVLPLGDGTYAVLLPDAFKVLVRDQLQQVRDLLLGDIDAPALRRLFPVAYADDAKKDREYQQMMRDDLLASRLAAFELVDESMGRDQLDEDQLAAWMRAVNAVRLVLGTVLDVGEEPVDIAPDDPDAQAYAVYEVFGHLVNDIVEALRAGGSLER